MSDFQNYMTAQVEVQRRIADRDAADAKLQLARQSCNAMMLLSQHEPLRGLGLDREKLRHVLSFIKHGDLARLARESEGAS